MKKELKQLRPGADGGIPHPTKAQRARGKPIKVKINPSAKQKHGWIA